MRKWLFDSRKKLNLTQDQMASKLGLSQSYYAQIENGDRQPVLLLTTAARISDIGDISLSTIRNHEEALAVSERDQA